MPYVKYDFSHVDDDYVKSLFFNEKGHANSSRLSERWMDLFPIIRDYLIKRYDDCDNPIEAAYRLYYNIDKIPMCKREGCTNHARFYPEKRNAKNRNGSPYTTYCSRKCYVNSQEFKDKCKKTSLERYGVEWMSQREDVKQKAKETCMKLYGHSTYTQTEEYKNSVDSWKDARSKKTNEVRKRNNSFAVSKEEDSILKLLKYRYDEVYTQHFNDLYPYRCDYYIPKLDLYIEYQGYFSHGSHPFNPESKSDVYLLERYKENLNEGHASYENFIKTWGKSDVVKRNKAKENRLNYLEVYRTESKHIYDFSFILDYIIKTYEKERKKGYSVLGADYSASQIKLINKIEDETLRNEMLEEVRNINHEVFETYEKRKREYHRSGNYCVVKTDADFTCRICGKHFDSLKSLEVHLRRVHSFKDIKQFQDYYNEYLKQPGDGVCITCGKPTEQLKFGYKKCCTPACARRYAVAIRDSKDKSGETCVEHETVIVENAPYLPTESTLF